LFLNLAPVGVRLTLQLRCKTYRRLADRSARARFVSLERT